MGHDETGGGEIHDHDHGARRADLGKGAGKGMILFFDAPSGLAGDMIIAALVDLGVPETVIAEAVAGVPITGFHLHFGTRVRSGIVASSFDVHVDDPQPERTYETVRRLIADSKVAEPVKMRALATFRKLAEAEARVHRANVDDVHFHEVGAVDAIADVIGSAAGLDWIDADLLVSALPIGRGYVRARHGTLPLPPPAVVECLASFTTYDGGADFEFVTPTGAAIVAAHARGSSRWPTMTLDRAGWGAGTATLPDRPNLLRAVLGTPIEHEREPAFAGSHVVIEANVDDATGELLAAAMEAVRTEGALDVWATPATMKKGRPAWILSALAERARSDLVAHAMLRETTSIGVRRYAVSRIERPRRVVVIETVFGSIPVKIAEGPYGPAQVKPEFSACLAAARLHGIPVREVVSAATAAARAKVHAAGS